MKQVTKDQQSGGKEENTRKGLTHSTLSGFFWTFSGAGVQAAFQLLVLVVLARLLPPASFGTVQAALVVLGFSSIFSQLGVGPAVVQRPTLHATHLRAGFTLSLLFSLGMAVLIWFLAPALAGFFRMGELTPVVRVMSLVFPMQGLSVVAESLLQRQLCFRWLAIREVVAFAAGFGVVGVAMAFSGFGVWALVGAHLSQNLLKTGILLVAQPHPKRLSLDRRAVKDLMYFGGGFTVARIGNYAASQGDSLVVGRFLGAAALGLYGRAHQLMTQPANLFGQAVDRVLFPAMAKVQSDSERLELAYRRSVAFVALVILPVSVPLILLAPELIHVLLGTSWEGAILPFQIFTAGMLFRTSYKMSDSIARATGAVYHRAWRQGVFAVLVAGGAWCGQFWGIPGVAFGVTVAIAINFLLMAQLSLTLAGMSWKSLWTAHVPALALTAVLSGGVWVLGGVMRERGFPPILILAAAGVLITISAFLLLRYFPRFFLGQDGQWMIRVLAPFVPLKIKLFHSLTRGAGVMSGGNRRDAPTGRPAPDQGVASGPGVA